MMDRGVNGVNFLMPQLRNNWINLVCLLYELSRVALNPVAGDNS